VTKLLEEKRGDTSFGRMTLVEDCLVKILAQRCEYIFLAVFGRLHIKTTRSTRPKRVNRATSKARTRKEEEL
jgi:hypothetical protein